MARPETAQWGPLCGGGDYSINWQSRVLPTQESVLLYRVVDVFDSTKTEQLGNAN